MPHATHRVMTQEHTKTRRTVTGRRAALVVLAAAALASWASAAPTISAYQNEAARTLRIAEALITVQRLPGLSIAVGVDDEVVFARGFGWADLENRVPVAPDTRFRIGSVSKLLTAAAVAKLAEERRLDLDAPVQRYVPSFPQKEFPVTSRQLAAHLGGIRHYREGGFFNREPYASVTESLEIFKNDPLLHEPGTQREYSTYGYVLLSAVVEGASGVEFLPYMEEAVFTPAAMAATGPEREAELIPHRARFYERDDEAGFANALAEDYSYKWAGGGFMSTAPDLVRFGLAILNGRLLQQDTVELLFTPQALSDGTPVREGIGWRNGVDWEGRRVAHHGGASQGARAFLLLYPDEKIVVAMLSNVAGANLFEAEAEAIAQRFLPPSGNTEPAESSGLEGLYSFVAETEDDPASGALYLRPEATDGSLGWVSRLYSTDAPIVDIEAEDGVTRVLVATSSGLVNMWLRASDEGFTGQWGFDAPSRGISGRRLAR